MRGGLVCFGFQFWGIPSEEWFVLWWNLTVGGFVLNGYEPFDWLWDRKLFCIFGVSKNIILPFQCMTAKEKGYFGNREYSMFNMLKTVTFSNYWTGPNIFIFIFLKDGQKWERLVKRSIEGQNIVFDGTLLIGLVTCPLQSKRFSSFRAPCKR